MSHALLICLISLSWAGPGEPPEPSLEEPDSSEQTLQGGSSELEANENRPGTLPSAGSETFGDVLQVAKQRYFAGEVEAARDLLDGLRQRLEAGEQASPELARQSMTYLGEVLFKLDDREAAKEAFRFILRRNVDAPISPYHHPIDVVNIFELVRAEVRLEQQTKVELPVPAEPPPRPGPPPLWTLAPLGLPQFAQGRPASGFLFGGLQLGFGAASLALREDLGNTNVAPEDDNEFDAVRERGLVRKFGLQWPATFAFYGTWLVSAVDASRTWRRRKLEASVSVGPVGRRGSGVWLRARF